MMLFLECYMHSFRWPPTELGKGRACFELWWMCVTMVLCMVFGQATCSCVMSCKMHCWQLACNHASALTSASQAVTCLFVS
jgi:hypothetical protein